MNSIEYGSPISLAAAKRVIAAAEAESQANGWQMVIVVLDSGGHLVALHRMDGVQLASLDVAQAKAQTSVRYRRDTRSFEQRLVEGGVQMRLLSMPHLCPVEGGLPLLVDGKLVGAIGVSGASSAQDGQVAAAGARALAG
ncbi:MAG: heme-binding protein [Steroidobacteraceae bacterium]